MSRSTGHEKILRGGRNEVPLNCQTPHLQDARLQGGALSRLGHIAPLTSRVSRGLHGACMVEGPCTISPASLAKQDSASIVTVHEKA